MIIDLLIHLVGFFACILGGMIDARMWGRKNDDPQWLQQNTDYIWLGGWNGYQSYAWFTAGWFACLLGSQFGLFHYYLEILISLIGLSVFWDLAFFKIESGVWVRPIRLWTKLSIPFFKISNRTFNSIFSIEDNSLVIGFNTVPDMMKFNIFRLAILLISIYIYVI